MKTSTFFLAICMLLSTVSFAQPGTLDSSFSKDGKVTNKIGWANSAAVQPDGNIVVAGTANDNFILVRYKPDGTLDKVFGINGIVTTDFGNTDYGKSVAIKSNGKIVVAGYTYGSTSDFALAQYKSNGQPDNTFGTNGKVITDFGGHDFGASVGIKSDGRIVVAGSTSNIRGYYDFALAQYKSNGQLDSAFGTNGKVTTDFGGASAYAVAIQTNGKIILAGATGYFAKPRSKENTSNVFTQYSAYSAGNFALARYNANGQLDNTFGTNGTVTTDFLGDVDLANSVILQSDGKIVAAGYTNKGSYYSFALARYKWNGVLDNTFGQGGKVTTYFKYNFIGNSFGSSIALQANGKIVMSGSAYNGTNSDFAVARYKSNGNLDSAFGVNGRVTTDFGEDLEGSSSTAIQSDGKIVIVGNSNDAFAIARYYGDNVAIAKNSNDNFSNLQKQNYTLTNIHIFPNPVKDILHLEGLCAASCGSSSSSTISIVDAKGKLLLQTKTSNSSYSFNVKQLSSGLYIIRIDEGDRTTTLKFIKE